MIVWADNDDQYVMINIHGAAVPLSGGPSCDSVACITGIAPQIISAAVNVAVVLRSGTMRGMVGELGVAPAELVPGEVQLSVVVPVCGCADCLAALHDRLTRSVAQITDRYERVFVDDRSQDSGWEVLGRLAQLDATAIEFDHAERHAGQSGYTLRKLVRFALDGMFFRSTVLLRLVVLLGSIIALAGIVLAAFEVVDYIVEPDKSVAGYTSLAVLLLLLAGFIIVSVGVVGLYVGRIFEQVKDRPLFLIDAQTESQDLSWPFVESLGQASRPDTEAPEAPAANA